MKLYRFSPIKDEKAFGSAVNYLIKTASDLCFSCIGSSLPISYITIFSHYEEEYEYILSILAVMGKIHMANNGSKAMLYTPICEGNSIIKSIRVRKPDPYRMQVGCCDFEVTSYEKFLSEYVSSSKGLRLIQRDNFDMIEFYHPDRDVLGYIVGPDKK